ncbi:hypothetical protein Tco_0067027 [Tanacetum coccineum]
MGEIIYSDLVTRLISKSRQKYVPYPRFVSCALEVLLGSDYTRDENFRSSPTILSNSNFSKDPSKVTFIKLTAFMVVVNNHEKSVTPLPFTIKKKKRKSQTVTPTLPKSQGLEASRSLPQKRKNPKSKMTPTETQVTPPTRPTEDSEQSYSVSLDKATDPEDPNKNKQLARMGLPSIVPDEALLLSNEDLIEESEDDIFEAEEEMDEDIQEPENEETQTHHSIEHTTEAHNENVNVLPLIERKLVQYLQKTYKLIQATMKIIDNINKVGIDERAKLLKALNRVSETLEADSALKEEMTRLAEAHTTTYGALSSVTELLPLAKTFDFSGLKSLVETLRVAFNAQNDHLAIGLSLLHLWPGMENADMEIQQTEDDKAEKEQVPKRPTRAVLISIVRPLQRTNPEVEILTSPSTPAETTPPSEPQVVQREVKGLATNKTGEPTKKLVPTSKECSVLDIITQAWMIGLANYLERESEVSSERKTK